MEIKFNIYDNKVAKFTNDSKNRLLIEAKKHIDNVINESDKVEDFLCENGASHEITENIVFQAIRRNQTISKIKTKKSVRLLKILSEFSLFISGLMFDQEKFSTDIFYFVAFSGIFIFALIITIIMHVKDGE